MHPGLRLARWTHLGVAAVLTLALTARLRGDSLTLTDTLGFLGLAVYPIGCAAGVSRLRPLWHGDRLTWLHALPLLLHAIAGLWGALAIASVALTGPAANGLRAALELGLLLAGVGFFGGWLLVLGLSTQVEGLGLLMRVTILVPLAFLLWMALTRPLGAGA